ncbi:MAG: (Fe-S)-binding protein [Acidobacteria bacterium]|nr:(Fe-S)-binding protein [Acidobacteriota bacterium]
MAKRVSLFVTCMVDQLLPQAGMAMADVLERAGFDVEFREAQTCCGLPAHQAGCAAQAREVGSHFLKTFADADYIVIPSTRCADMLSRDLPRLFPDDPSARGDAQAVSTRVWEFSRFLLEVAKVDSFGARFPHRVTYFDTCPAPTHSGARDLLQRVQDLEYVEMNGPAECCGFGGNFRWNFPAAADAMTLKQVERILASKATHVVGLDVACLLQLRRALEAGNHPVQALHLAEVLASR